MGFFNLFSKKQKNNEVEKEAVEPSEHKKETRKTARLNTQTERLVYIKDNCELIMESNRQIEEAKVEYQAVTSYLTDMQKIDMIPLEQRGNMEDAARNIYNLTKERNKLQKRNSILSDRQYRLFERYELQIPKELPSIRDNEKYQIAISQDITHLEKEREALDEEQEDIIGKQAFLKGIATTTSIIVVILFALFAFLSSYYDANFTIPFLMTVLMGMASAFYIFFESRKNISDDRLVKMKQNRQIMLMNKVKIKAVNNRNYLDYSYNKYMIENSEQLKLYWDEYTRLKEEARRYQKNTDLLEFYNNELIHELKKFNISDAEIWIFQTTAILNNKEMVEVRHRLNVRRQKLRERIDINTKQKEEGYKAIRNTIKTYPDCREEAEKLLRRFRINMDE
ncbi:MAG TPA: hypothetical protein VN258_06700 [Mobilitalea sp.]|nr:hypothetical protein [Mobilitalea sp.]